jgi:hypothetical protein
MLLVADESTHAELVQEIQHRGDYFVVELESTSMVSAPFLNITVFERILLDGTGALRVRYKFKPTALSIPLSARSGQALSVHSAWPSAMLKSINALCSFPHDAERACAELRERLSTTSTPVIRPTSATVAVRPHLPEIATLLVPFMVPPVDGEAPSTRDVQPPTKRTAT